MKAKEILNYKRIKGYSTDENNFIYANKLPGFGEYALLGVASLVKAKYFIVSFETEGIVFMPMTLMAEFAGEDILLPHSEIDSVIFEKGILNNTLIISKKAGKIKLQVPKVVAVFPFQRENVKFLMGVL